MYITVLLGGFVNRSEQGIGESLGEVSSKETKGEGYFCRRA